SICLLLRPGHPPALLSFPTRRSSDLSARLHYRQDLPAVTLPYLTFCYFSMASKIAAFVSSVARLFQLSSQASIPFIISNSTSSLDRKSTRLNSSHVKISYAVFCLKKK